jgi:hypothetical protein
LRKTAAFFLGLFLVLTLGYATLHPAYVLMSDWLGPVLGSSLLSAFTLVYLLLGDPLSFFMVAFIWGGVSILGGMIIRRRAGAVLTMLLLFVFLLPLLAANLFDIAQAFPGFMGGDSGENPFDVMPPLPEGLTFAQLYEAPIIGMVLEEFIEITSSFGGGEMPNLMGIAFSMAGTLAIGVAAKLLIIVVTAILGVEVGKRLEVMFAPQSESLRLSLGGKPRSGGSPPAAPVQPVAFFVLFMIVLSSLSAGLPLGLGADDEFYSENMMGYVDEGGTAYMGDVFLDSEGSIGGMDWGGSATENLMGALMLTRDGMDESLLEGYGMGLGEMGSMINLIPETMMAAIYVDIPPEEAESLSGPISDAFSSEYGIDFNPLFTFNPPMMGDENATGPPLQISIVLYQTDADFSEMADGIVDALSENGGLADLIGEAVSNGALIPGQGEGSADGSAFMAGFFNLDLITSRLGEEAIPDEMNEFIALGFEGPLTFTGGVSYWEDGIAYEEDGETLDLLGLLGIEGDVTFSPESDLSNFFVASGDIFNPEEEGDPSMKLVTSLPLDDLMSGLFNDSFIDSGIVTVVDPGGTIDPSSLELGISGLTLPLNVKITKSVSDARVKKGNRVEVTITIQNNDDNAILNVELDDGGSISSYSMSSRLTSGSTSGYWPRIDPGESETISYTVELENSGVYSLSPAEMSYVNEESSFAKSSDKVEVRVALTQGTGVVFQTLGVFWGVLETALDLVTGGSGSMVLTGTALVLGGLLVFLEFRGFRKWIQGA